MLYSNEGIINISNNAIEFQITSAEHELFLNQENALQHKKWLQNKVSEFVEIKEKLQEIRDPYSDVGNWIYPGKSCPKHKKNGLISNANCALSTRNPSQYRKYWETLRRYIHSFAFDKTLGFQTTRQIFKKGGFGLLGICGPEGMGELGCICVHT